MKILAVTGLALLAAVPVQAQQSGDYGAGAYAQASVSQVGQSTDGQCVGTSVNPCNIAPLQSQGPGARAAADASKSGSYTYTDGQSREVTQTGSSRAFGSADLATGEVKAYATGTRPDTSLGGSGFATVRMTDTIFIDAASFNGQSSLDIPISLRVDGNYGGGIDGSSFGLFYFYAQASSDSAGVYIRYTGSSESDDTHDPSNVRYEQLSGWSSYDTDRFDGVLTIEADRPSFYFDMALQAGAFFGATSDFSHTGAFTLDLPPGVTFTSASGAFLTAANNNAIPEPATWALLITGFGLVGATARRRQARSQPLAAAATRT